MSNSISKPRKNPVEPWLRLWLPTDTWERFRGIDEDFLSPHGGKGGIGSFLEGALSGTAQLSEFADTPFLMLLGRPDSGKSSELRLAKAYGWLGSRTVLIEGKEIGTTNPALYFQTVLAGSLAGPSRLIIDGLDEVLLVNSQFVSQFKAWLRQDADENGRPRHDVAISCRWADWPESAIADLAALWPPGDSKSLVLAPLRRSDALETLTRRLGEVQAEVFWRQLRELRLLPVACWPQGFLSLIRSFEDSGYHSVASSHADVVREEIVRLCRLADSPDDLLRYEQSVEGAEWRQRIAGRLAATMIVSGRAHLTLATNSSSLGGNDLSVEELGATDELWESRRVVPKLADLHSLVHLSSLMRRLSTEGRWVFESQVYQEWLAADWLAARQLGIPRLRQIFGVEVEGEWVVAQPMRATAAWLARFDAEFRDLLLQEDPLTLLRIDGASLPDKDRKDIVDALLAATDSIRVLDPAIHHAHLPSLKHSGLAEQLGLWLKRSDVTDATKELAIELAGKTNLYEISDVLWEIYAEAGSRLRTEIGGALFRLAREGHDDKWRAVLAGDIPSDDHGNLLGAALEIMVIESRKVPFREVLQQVLPERRFRVYGLYASVVRRLHLFLTIADLPMVFNRLAERPETIRDSLSRARDLSDQSVRLALSELDRPEILQSLVEYWHACLRRHVTPNHESAEFSQMNESKRHDFVKGLVRHPEFERHRDRSWVDAEKYLIQEGDFEWCLEQMQSATSENEWRFGMLACAIIWRADLAGPLAQRLDAAWEKSAALRGMLPTPESEESISSALIRIATENQAKREAKGNHENKRFEQRQEAQRKRMALETVECHKAHDRGESVWPGVFGILMFRETLSTSGIVSFSQLSGIGTDDDWMRASAARFLVASPQKSDFGSDYALHGLLALAVCPEELDRDEAVRKSIEAHWLEHFIPRLCNHGMGDPPAGIGNERFAALFPEAFARAFDGFCRSSYRNNSSLSELHQLVKIHHRGLVPGLKSILVEEELAPAGFFTALWCLSRADEAAAIAVALHWLPKLAGGLPREVAAVLLGSAAVLVNGRLTGEIAIYLEDSSLVFDAIRAAASKLAWHEREMDFSSWTDHALKILGDAIWKAYPDPDRLRNSRGNSGFHGVTDEDHAMEFRDRLSAAAWSRGIDLEIPEVCEGENEENAAQRRHMIDWHLHVNRQARAGTAWKAMRPLEFLRLADHPHARLARDSGELMAAAMECLERWERSLENDGTWDNLWNLQKPKLETRIAVEMRDWLRGELKVPVECEITLASGDRSDILLSTIPSDGKSPPLHLVIELKIWRSDNAKERRTAMSSQLVDQYLRPRAHEGWTHGLYVVAWTPTPGSKADSEEAMQRECKMLERQANELSVPPFLVKSMVIDARYRGKLATGKSSPVRKGPNP